MIFLRFKDLQEKKGIPFTRIHINRLEKEGRFPKRVEFGLGTVAWVENEVDSWLQERLQKRETMTYDDLETVKAAKARAEAMSMGQRRRRQRERQERVHQVAA